MQLAPKQERAAVAKRAHRFQLGPLAGLPVEVPAQPRLALGDERFGKPLGFALRPSRPCRDRDNGRVPRIDREPQEPRPGRAPDRAFEAAAGKAERSSPFGRRRHRTRVAWDGAQPLAQRLAQPQNATQPSRHSDVLGIVWMPQ